MDLGQGVLKACLLELVDYCWRLAVQANETERKIVLLLSP